MTTGMLSRKMLGGQAAGNRGILDMRILLAEKMSILAKQSSGMKIYCDQSLSTATIILRRPESPVYFLRWLVRSPVTLYSFCQIWTCFLPSPDHSFEPNLSGEILPNLPIQYGSQSAPRVGVSRLSPLVARPRDGDPDSERRALSPQPPHDLHPARPDQPNRQPLSAIALQSPAGNTLLCNV